MYLMYNTAYNGFIADCTNVVAELRKDPRVNCKRTEIRESGRQQLLLRQWIHHHTLFPRCVDGTLQHVLRVNWGHQQVSLLTTQCHLSQSLQQTAKMSIIDLWTSTVRLHNSSKGPPINNAVKICFINCLQTLF